MAAAIPPAASGRSSKTSFSPRKASEWRMWCTRRCKICTRFILTPSPKTNRICATCSRSSSPPPRSPTTTSSYLGRRKGRRDWALHLLREAQENGRRASATSKARSGWTIAICRSSRPTAKAWDIKKGDEPDPKIRDLPRTDRRQVLVPHLYPRRRHPALQERPERAHPHDREVSGLQAVRRQVDDQFGDVVDDKTAPPPDQEEVGAGGAPNIRS